MLQHGPNCGFVAFGQTTTVLPLRPHVPIVLVTVGITALMELELGAEPAVDEDGAAIAEQEP
jgi:hypothetical protein